MNTLSDDDVRELLKRALPVPGAAAPPPDLWSAVRRRIDRAPQRPLTLDYVLLAAVVLLCLLRPSLIAFLLLHL